MLGALVFADDLARRDLEAIVHPAVYRAIQAGLRAFELLGDAPVVAVAIPLLYETGHEGDFNPVVATICPEAMQVDRLRKRGLTEDEARRRLRAQLSAIDKAARADLVIDTSGSFEETDRQIDETVGKLRRLRN